MPEITPELTQEIAKLLTEQPNPASASIDELPTEEVLRIINQEDRQVADAVWRELPAIARAVDAIVTAFERGGRLFYIGAGTSGRLGVLDASECPPTFSVPPEMVQGIVAGGEAALSRATEITEDDPAIGVRDLCSRGFTERDVLVGIAASGRTPHGHRPHPPGFRHRAEHVGRSSAGRNSYQHITLCKSAAAEIAHADCRVVFGGFGGAAQRPLAARDNP